MKLIDADRYGRVYQRLTLLDFTPSRLNSDGFKLAQVRFLQWADIRRSNYGRIPSGDVPGTIPYRTVTCII